MKNRTVSSVWRMLALLAVVITAGFVINDHTSAGPDRWSVVYPEGHESGSSCLSEETPQSIAACLQGQGPSFFEQPEQPGALFPVSVCSPDKGTWTFTPFSTDVEDQIQVVVAKVETSVEVTCP